MIIIIYFSRLYRELCLYKQILDAKSDFSKLCVECKNFKSSGQSGTAVCILYYIIVCILYIIGMVCILCIKITIYVPLAHQSGTPLVFSKTKNFNLIQATCEYSMYRHSIICSFLPQDIGLQACYDCFNKICYPLCGMFWYSYSINWPKVKIINLCLKLNQMNI